MSDQGAVPPPWPAPGVPIGPNPPPPVPPIVGPSPTATETAWPVPPPPSKPPPAPVGLIVLLVVAVLVLAGLVVAATVAGDTDDGVSASELADDGLFVDPQEEYAIELGPDWEQVPDFMSGSEGFVVAPPVDGFAPNVNVIVTRDAAGVDVAEYVELSIENMPNFVADGEVIDSGVLEGSDLGFIEYTAEFPGPGTLHFLAVTAIADDQAVTATFTSTPDRFEELRREVEPYLRTLQPLGD